MKKVLNFVKGKREEKRFGGASDVVTVRNLSPEGGLDEDIRGYDVDLTGKDKTLSKLHKAAWTGNLEKLKGSMRKTDLDLADKQGRTPLHLASVQGHSNIVWFLISNRAKINVKDHEGKTPLLKSIECKQQECAQLLLERGADVNVADNFGNTGLHLASAQGCNELSAALLRKGAKLESPNRAGECALHLATRGGHKEMAEFLLRYGSEVNLADADERTPLMLAAKSGNQGLVALFLEYGADCSAMDSNGWTAEDYAVLGGHTLVASELQSRSEDLQGTAVLPKFQERPVDVPDSSSILPMLPERELPIPEEEESKGAFGSSDDELKHTDTEMDSPRSLPDMPPPLKPPRSWDLIQAGLTMPKGGVIPRQRNVFPRPRSWDQRSASLAGSPWDSPASSPVGAAPSSLVFHSLTRPPRNSKKPRPTSLPVTLPQSLLPPDPPAKPSPVKVEPVPKEAEKEKNTELAASRDSVSSDWDSEEDSLPLDNLDNDNEKKEIENEVVKKSPLVERRGRFLLRRTQSIDLADEEVNINSNDKESATLGREGTMQGRDEMWQANATIIAQSPDSSSSSEDFFFQSNRNRIGSLKHQATVIQAQVESNTNKPSAIPEDLELDSSPDIENKLIGLSTSVTKESLNLESSPDVEEKILKITNSLTKESLNAQSSPDIEEKLLERSTSIIKQSFDLDSSPEFENKITELEKSIDDNKQIEIEEKVEHKNNIEIYSSPEVETKMIEDINTGEKVEIKNNEIEIPQLLLQNLVDLDSSPDLEDQKILDISATVIPECSETEMSPELENKNIETKIEEPQITEFKLVKPISNELKKLIIASEPQEKNVWDTTEKEKTELESEKFIIEVPKAFATPDSQIIKERSLNIADNLDDEEKENNPAPPPRKKKIRASSLSRTSPEMAINNFKRSLSLGPSRPERKPRRQIKEQWEGNNTALVRIKKRHQDSKIDVKDLDLSDRDSVGTHSDDTSLCYTKSPHAILKRRLRAVTADRARLEHVLAGYEEQNRRIQYELADALHAARTQREISTQLARQLAKAQKGQLQALEEFQVIQLQLNASNTELNWLRDLYEGGKSVSPLNEREDARLEWEHQHQLEQLRAEKSKVLIEKSKVEQQMTAEIAKLKEDVLKWMKLYESSNRNISGNTCESQQEKVRLENLVTSLRTDLEMSLRKQGALEKELATKQGKSTVTKDAATNTQQSGNSESLARELTAEKERSRRGVQQVRKLRAEVQSLRARVLAAERRSQSSLSGASSGSNNNYLHSPTETESVAVLRRQLEELSRSVEEERAQRATLEKTISDLRNNPEPPDMLRVELERVRRSLDEEKLRRQALEMRAGSNHSENVTRAELDKVRRSYEVALARAKHEAELSAREELSLKLAQVNTFLEEQLQQQSRLEQLRCTSESQLRQDFQQTRHKLLSELAKVQATLKARNDEDRRLRKQMLSPRSEQARTKFSDHITHTASCHHEPISSSSAAPSMKPLRPAAAVLSLLVPPLPPPPVPPPSVNLSTNSGYHVLRRELEFSIRKAAEAADRDEPILSDPDDEQLAILKKKYFL